MNLLALHKKMRNKALHTKYTPHEVCDAICNNISYTVIKRDGSQITKTLTQVVDEMVTVAGLRKGLK